jgi:tryptophan-rich sensory protein
MRKVIIAVYIMVVLWGLIAVTLTLFWLLDTVAGAILVPYLLWVSYALTLNIYIVKNNSVESLQHQYPE